MPQETIKFGLYRNTSDATHTEKKIVNGISTCITKSIYSIYPYYFHATPMVWKLQLVYENWISILFPTKIVTISIVKILKKNSSVNACP
jgi:ABC-type thiamin/hydroxymethylpyrimidine transport system permease subunit